MLDLEWSDDLFLPRYLADFLKTETLNQHKHDERNAIINLNSLTQDIKNYNTFPKLSMKDCQQSMLIKKTFLQ